MCALGAVVWGDPLDRDPEMVKADVIEEFVSAEKALNEYAVVLDPISRAVDVAATKRLRETTRSNRNVLAVEGRS